MHRRLGAVAPLLLVVATTGLSACGSKKADTAATPTPTPVAVTTPDPAEPAPTSTTAASTPVASSPTATPVPSADATPAGTTLKVGDAATIDYTDSLKPTRNGKISVTVDSITKGSMGDFANVQLDAKDKNSTPYYVKATVKNTGTTDLTGSNPAQSLSGVDDRDQQQNSLIMMGTFDKCDDASAPKSLKAGQSYTSCGIYLIPGGGSIKGAVWTLYDAKTNKSDINWR